MSLRSVLLTKDIFRAGISVAPVTDWRQYDTAYTERYMQRPEDNPEGYDSTSLFDAAKKLDVPLLLAHGLGDDNVHFANTGLFVNALIEAGKSFRVMFYPGAKHGIRESKARTHLFSVITRFIENNL
jgi:dipeptidyl-peptidase-4